MKPWNIHLAISQSNISVLPYGAISLLSLGDEIPDGSNAYIYYGKLHTLSVTSSTIATRHEDLITAGACGYAAVEWAIYAVNRVNVGGITTAAELLGVGSGKA